MKKLKKQLVRTEDLQKLQAMKDYINELDRCNRLHIIEELQYQQELKRLSEELDKLERIYLTNVFDDMCGNPMEKLNSIIDQVFNRDVHKAIEEVKNG